VSFFVAAWLSNFMRCDDSDCEEHDEWKEEHGEWKQVEKDNYPAAHRRKCLQFPSQL